MRSLGLAHGDGCGALVTVPGRGAPGEPPSAGRARERARPFLRRIDAAGGCLGYAVGGGGGGVWLKEEKFIGLVAG